MEPNGIVAEVTVMNDSEIPAGNVRITVVDPKDLVIPESDSIYIEMVDPGSSEKAKLLLKPRYSVGTTELSVKARLFDFNVKEEVTVKAKPLPLSFKIPKLTPQKKSEDDWRIFISRLPVAEVETVEVDMPPQKLFDQLSQSVSKVGMFSLEPQVTPSLYRGMVRLFGSDPNGVGYATEVQVIGSMNQSKALLRFWCSDPARLYGLTATSVVLADRAFGLKKYVK